MGSKDQTKDIVTIEAAGSSRARRAVVPLLIAVLPAVMLYTLWANPTSAGEDDLVYYYPLRTMLWQQLRAGQWPLWNQYESCGVPLLADPQSGLFHPANWLGVVLDDKLAYSLAVMLALATAGVGAYVYLRRLGAATVAAAFGAIAFQYSGFMVGHRVHLAMIQAAAMLPWGLWAIELARGRSPLSLDGRGAGVRVSPFRRSAVAIAVVLALTLAAGHWPTAILMMPVWGAYLLFRGRPMKRALAAAVVGGAMGVLLVAPQVLATLAYVRQTVRAGVPYSQAVENSFFPLSGVLAFFPFLLGNRTPNFFDQPWWGAWHLCEMLGYVGLATLALAASAMWRLYRKPVAIPENPAAVPAAAKRDLSATVGRREDLTSPGMVKFWTWAVVIAGVWSLGMYWDVVRLPIYKLIYALPMIGKIRCPARMLLVVDLGLAYLAAAAVQCLCVWHSRPRLCGRPDRLRRTLRRWALAYLPVCMAVALGLVALAAFGEGRWWRLSALLSSPLGGPSADQLLKSAVSFTSPTVLVPLGMLALTIAALLWVTRAASVAGVPPARAEGILPSPAMARPRGRDVPKGQDARDTKRQSPRAWLLVLLLLADLAFITRFVDVPPEYRTWPSPQASPAAAWLKQHAPQREPFRVLGLAGDYHDRAGELLQPKACATLGVESIAYYGPLGRPEYARLLGFRPWGANEFWPWLIRTNHLLSLFNVRYVLAAEPQFRDVIESVRIPDEPAPPDGPDLLAGQWSTADGRTIDGGVEIRQTGLVREGLAVCAASINQSGVYRLALDTRVPQGSDNYVAGQYCPDGPAGAWIAAIRVDAEQLTDQWRHFELTFQVAAGDGGRGCVKISTRSLQPVQVRNVTLRRSSWDTPINFDDRLPRGAAVYVDRTPEGLPPLRAGDPPVHIYENALCLPRTFQVVPVTLAPGQSAVEELRWRAREYLTTRPFKVLTDSAGDSSPGTFISQSPESLGGAAEPASANVLGALAAGPGAKNSQTIYGFLPWGKFLPLLGLTAVMCVGLLGRRRRRTVE